MRNINSRFDSIPDDGTPIYGEGSDALNQFGMLINGCGSSVTELKVPEYAEMYLETDKVINISSLDNMWTDGLDIGTATKAILVERNEVSTQAFDDGARILYIASVDGEGKPITFKEGLLKANYDYFMEGRYYHVFIIKDYTENRNYYQIAITVEPSGATPIVSTDFKTGAPTIIWTNAFTQVISDLKRKIIELDARLSRVEG